MSEIPEHHQQICRELAAIAKKHGLSRMSVTYRPGYADKWNADINLGWESGRHEDAVNRINITSTTFVCTSIKDDNANQTGGDGE